MRKRLVLILAAFAFCAPHPACAEPFYVRGRISQIGPNSDYLKVFVVDPQSAETDEMRIEVQPATLFRGASSIRNFRVGDLVQVSGELNDYEKIRIAQVIEPPD